MLTPDAAKATLPALDAAKVAFAAFGEEGATC